MSWWKNKKTKKQITVRNTSTQGNGSIVTSRGVCKNAKYVENLMIDNYKLIFVGAGGGEVENSTYLY